MFNIGRIILTGKAEVTGEKHVPVPLSPTQIPHGLVWDKRVLQVQRPKTDRLRLRVNVTAILGELTRRASAPESSGVPRNL
jgi:hypothetical protein